MREAVLLSDCLVYLITPHSIAKGNYALTEPRHAQEKWPHPIARIVPVIS